MGALFDGTILDARVVAGGTWSASTVKMAYAAWTKGTAALLLTVRALARSGGVEETLLAEWELSQPALADRSDGAARSATAKGWRWVAEMEEIAATMAAAGLPDGFHQAAAEIFRRSPHDEPDHRTSETAGPGRGPAGPAADGTSAGCCGDRRGGLGASQPRRLGSASSSSPRRPASIIRAVTAITMIPAKARAVSR